MNLATIRMKKKYGWLNLEEEIAKTVTNFKFEKDVIYRIQLLAGAISLCELDKEPNNEGRYFDKINEYIMYQKGKSTLYVIPKNFDYAEINVEDNK